MFNPLVLLGGLKGSLNTILVLVGFLLLGYVGFKFYSMNEDIKERDQTISYQKSELTKKDELFRDTVQAYEISIVEVEQVAYNKALKKEINKNLDQVKSTLKKEAEKKQKEVLNVKDTCSKCYSTFVF